MKTLPCFKCSEDLRPVFEGSGVNQPYKGVCFFTHGQYGSTVFDEMDGSKLEINICDRCLIKGRADVLHLQGAPGRKWKAWKPDVDREHLKALDK